MITDSLAIVAVLALIVAVSEWLAQRTSLRHVGTPLLVILFTAVAANIDVIPVYGPDTPVYGAIFKYLAPLGIFWLLLLVDLRNILKAGGPTLTLFLFGAFGTALGAFLGHWALGGEAAFGELHAALAGMFTGTYIGGSVNFNAVALEYNVVENGALYAGAAAVDNAMTTVWMAACVALPRLLAGIWSRRLHVSESEAAPEPIADEVGTTSVYDMAVLTALGLGAVALTDPLALWLQELTGVAIPGMLILSTMALILGQVPFVQRLRGARLFGLLVVYLFLAVIGALCDVDALLDMGRLAPALGGFVCILVGVHAVIVFGAAWLLRMDAATAAVASQANIGGGTSALALARSLNRGDLELPAILVGSVGLALGNYLGFLVAGLV